MNQLTTTSGLAAELARLLRDPVFVRDLTRWIHKLGPDWHSAEDIVAEGILGGLKTNPESVDSAERYLRGVVRRKFQEWLREKPLLPLPATAATPEPGDDSDDRQRRLTERRQAPLDKLGAFLDAEVERHTGSDGADWETTRDLFRRLKGAVLSGQVPRQKELGAGLGLDETATKRHMKRLRDLANKHLDSWAEIGLTAVLPPARAGERHQFDHLSLLLDFARPGLWDLLLARGGTASRRILGRIDDWIFARLDPDEVGDYFGFSFLCEWSPVAARALELVRPLAPTLLELAGQLEETDLEHAVTTRLERNEFAGEYE